MNSVVGAAIRDYHDLLDAGYLTSAEETLARELGLSPALDALVQMEPADLAEVCGRLDGFVNADALRLERCYVDLNPFIWHGERASGAIVRVSTSALMNVTAGAGSMTPLFIIRARA